MNHLRGDKTIQLGDQSITLRPTFNALATIEQQTGYSLIALTRRLANGEAKLAELHSIIVASALSPVPDVDNTPLLDLQEQLLDFLITALTGETHAQ